MAERFETLAKLWEDNPERSALYDFFISLMLQSRGVSLEPVDLLGIRNDDYLRRLRDQWNSFSERLKEKIMDELLEKMQKSATTTQPPSAPHETYRVKKAPAAGISIDKLRAAAGERPEDYEPKPTVTRPGDNLKG